ncbi:MAG: hypothetical protein KF764_05930 [Labilithrix sp.]|nr:hypothetical protein [Labilithrix sp.]
MRNHRQLWVAASIVASGGVFACVGGGGNLGDGMTTWDPAPSSLESAGSDREPSPGFLERAPSSQEPAGNSSEPAAGAQGGGGSPGSFQCSGTFTCQEAGKKGTDRIRLRLVDGVCTLSGTGSVAVVLQADGSLAVNGSKIGTWSASGNGFTVVSSEGSVTCTRGSSGSGSDDSTDSSSSGSGSAGSPGSVPPSVDAGSPGSSQPADAG